MGISLRLVIVILVVVVGVAAMLISLLPVRAAGLSAVRSTASLLRTEISNRLVGDIKAYFSSPMEAISSTRSQYDVGLLNVSDCWNTIPTLSSIGQRMKLPVYTADPSDMVCYVYGSGSGFWNSQGPNGVEWWGDIDTSTYATNITTGPDPGFFRPTQRPWYDTVAAGQGWGPIYVEKDSTTVTTVSPGGPFLHPDTGALTAVMAMDVRNDFLLDYFATVSIAKTGRAILLKTSQRVALGGNWNESVVIPINNSYEQSTLATVYQIQEPLFAQTVEVLGESGLFDSTLPIRTTIGKGKDLVYIDVVEISDSFGLDLRLVVMIPEKDFLAEVDRNVNTSIGAACGAVVALLIIAFIITVAVTQPLTELGVRMINAASFQDDDDDSESIISEVANIQRTFGELSKELKRVKSYLPRSILAMIENFEEEDEGDVGQSTIGGRGGGTSTVGKGSHMKSGGNTYVRRGTRTAVDRGSMRSSAAASSIGASLQGSVAAAGMKGGTLFTEDSINTKKITVVMINIRGTHRRLKDDWRNFKTQQGVVLERVQELCKQFKGVIDHFQGDHITITFNAVITIGSHQSKAAHLALALKREYEGGIRTGHQKAFSSGGAANNETDTSFSEGEIDSHTSASLASPQEQSPDAAMGGAQPQQAFQPLDSTATAASPFSNPNPISIGIATGECVVGNMGTETMKHFNIVGPAYTNAMVLERLCKQYNQPVMTHHTAAHTMSFDTVVQAVGAFDLSSNTQGVKRTSLYTLVAHRDAREDEWMYQLKDEESDITSLMNMAWNKLCGKDFGEAKDLVGILRKKRDDLSLSKDPKMRKQFTPLHYYVLLRLEEAITFVTNDDNRAGEDPATKEEEEEKDGAKELILQNYLQKESGRYYVASILPSDS